jgi:class 3 adenylate cyclase/CHASE2 domain-containing sensor protein
MGKRGNQKPETRNQKSEGMTKTRMPKRRSDTNLGFVFGASFGFLVSGLTPPPVIFLRVATSAITRAHKRSRTERRLRVRALALGALLTVLVVLLFRSGHLEWLEGKLYDARAHWCQFFRKPPTDRLVHVDIDDGALETIGRWPWHRNVLADVVDELGRAGTKALAFDILLTEPEEPKIDAAGNVTDYDALLAAAIGRMGNALIPASMTFEKPPLDPPAVTAAIAELSQNLELSYDQLNQKLSPLAQPSIGQDQYIHALRRAMDARIRGELPAKIPVDALRVKLLPAWNQSQFDQNAPDARIFNQQYLQIQSELALESFSLPMPGPLPVLHAYSTIAPLPVFASVARYGGLVDHIPESDGKVRRVPLVVEFHGRLIPQMALVLACAALDVDPHHLQISSSQIVIPTPDGQNITIPVASRSTRLGKVGMFMDVPWFGKGVWQTMYPGPRGQHLNISWLYELANWRRLVRFNNALIDDALKDVRSITNDKEPLEKYKALRLTPDDFLGRLPAASATLSDKEILDSIEMIRAAPPNQRDKDYETALKSFDALTNAVQQNKTLLEQIDQRSAELRQAVNGHVVLIGDVASSSTDLVNTPLAAQVPGVVTHGAIVNAILTRQLWTEAPVSVTILHTIIVGLLATIAVALLKHWQAAVAVVVLLIGYLIFNGIFLFDLHNYLVGAAAPVTAMVLVWTAVNLVTVIVESAERARITHHFRTYVDPQLADYFLENPERLHLRGQIKELTVVFTDLAGFTTITEKLGERTVDILNEYLKVMVPIIRSRRGLVNKFLGDGIMIIFGALWENPDHATNAVDTVLEMLKATQKFSEELKSRGLPAVNMRAGISTGKMIVGDAGSDTARDYTVLGDAVNTGARLEQANKRLDTQILISGGTFRHLDSRFVLRPVGNLMLAGKTEAVEAYEVVAHRTEATAAHLRLAELSDIIIKHVNTGKIADCRDYIETIVTEFGPSKFTLVYEKLCLDAVADTKKPPPTHISA